MLISYQHWLPRLIPMIDQNELIQNLETALDKTKLARLADMLKKQDFPLGGLIDLTFYKDNQIAARASWLLENILVKSSENYSGDLEYLINRIKNVKHVGCVKHYAKLMMHLTSPVVPKTVRKQMSEINLEPVIEQCFDWMTDPRSIVTVKYAAAEALFNMRHRYPWLAEELSIQLEKLMHKATPLLASRISDLLGYLHPE